MSENSQEWLYPQTRSPVSRKVNNRQFRDAGLDFVAGILPLYLLHICGIGNLGLPCPHFMRLP
jgi:hypothetical protein